MATFFCKLIGPRPTFPADITPEELQLMQAHGVYWAGLMAQGKVVVFGLVGDPKGPYGIGVVQAEHEAEARALTDADPVIRAAVGFRYEVLLMPRVTVRQ